MCRKDVEKNLEKDSNIEKNGKGLEMYVYECVTRAGF